MARKMEERFAQGTETDPANRWRGSMQPTQAEAALRTAAIDIGLGPVFHQKNEQVDAHLLVCFLRGKGLGTSARKLVEAVGTIRSMDVSLPVKRGDREVTPSLVGGSRAGRGCCDVAGAPWAKGDKGLAACEKCSGQSGALDFGNPSKSWGTASPMAKIGLSRADSVGSVVLARSASATPLSFVCYVPRTGPRLAHSSACGSSCLAITFLPTESARPSPRARPRPPKQ